MTTEAEIVNKAVFLPTMTTCPGFSGSLVFEIQQHLDQLQLAAHPIKPI
jgi:hypothetical protein